MSKGTYLGTYTGGKFFPLDPQPEQVDILDIAHSLSMQCRYSGHTKQFYSVAEHSVLVSRALDDDDYMAQWGLLHDAAEAYLSDIPRPLKAILPEYSLLEEKVLKVIVQKYGLAWPMPDAVKRVDSLMLFLEAPRLMYMPLEEMIDFNGSDYSKAIVSDGEDYWRDFPALKVGCDFPKNAKASFIWRFNELFPNYRT
jgi:uncharacterized protein